MQMVDCCMTNTFLQVIVPDKWKEGASNVTEGGGRKLNENKLLSKKQRYCSQTFSSFLIVSQQDSSTASGHHGPETQA